MIGNAGESLADLLRIDTVHLATLVAPVLGSLEEVRLAVLVRERRIDVAGQSRPALGDELRIALLHGVRGQLVELVALEGVRLALGRVEERVHLGVLANGIVQGHLRGRERWPLGGGRVEVGGSQLVRLPAVQRLDGRLVVLVQLEDGLKAAIEGRHQR